jgi:adenylosuccinate lyase
MAHVHTYGIAAPAAAGIIHWGATSWYGFKPPLTL